MSTIGTDIALLVCDASWDLFLSNGDLIGDGGLESAVAISLFTDRRVNEEQLPGFTTDKKGWWGDMIPPVEGDQIGSRFWTLQRAKITNETLRLFEDYTLEALEWLITDGVADRVEASAVYDENFFLNLTVDIYRPNRDATRFNLFWDEQTTRILNNSQELLNAV